MKHILIDLDGTLAYYDPDKDYDPTYIGAPIPSTVQFINDLLGIGIEVKIFTARAEDSESIPFINEWVKQNIGRQLEITNVKTKDTVAIIDDRAYNLVRNQGSVYYFGEEMLKQFSKDLEEEFDSIPKIKLIGMKHE